MRALTTELKCLCPSCLKPFTFSMKKSRYLLVRTHWSKAGAGKASRSHSSTDSLRWFLSVLFVNNLVGTALLINSIFLLILLFQVYVSEMESKACSMYPDIPRDLVKQMVLIITQVSLCNLTNSKLSLYEFSFLILLFFFMLFIYGKCR